MQTKLQSSKIINKTLSVLDINLNMKTNPKEIKKILTEMYLNDFKTKYSPIKIFLSNAKTKPQNLKPLLENIQKGIITKHPAILEFLQKALNKKWLKPNKGIIKTIYFSFILEALTAAMANSNTFTKEIQKHFLSKRKNYGIKNSSSIHTFWKVLKKTKSFFDAAKTISVDPVIAYYIIKRDLKGKPITKLHLKNLLKNKKITFFQYKSIFKSVNEDEKNSYTGLRVNISEAGITEYKKGFISNAFASHTLNENLISSPPLNDFSKRNIFPEHHNGNFYNSLANNNNFTSKVKFSKEWISLYETWNLTFILGELSDPHIFFSKLLIPSVIDSKPENYMFTRVLALWLSFNFYILNKFEDKEACENIKNKEKMVKAWGKINKKYAYKLIKNKTSLNKSFKKFFSWPIYNLIKSLVKY